MLTTQARQHRTDLALLVALAAGDLSEEMRDAPVGDARGWRDALAAALVGLVVLYGEAAGALGADWYDDLRERAEVPGRFQAIVADLPDVGRTDSLAGWAAEAMFGADPDPAAALGRAEGGLQRIILDVDRQTVAGSAVADRAAGGWQRVGVGECAFCRMLIARGAVYSEATATFASHDHCRCVAQPAWGGQAVPVKAYTPSTRNITDRDRARVREWLRENPQPGAPASTRASPVKPKPGSDAGKRVPGAKTAERAASVRAQLAGYEKTLADGGGTQWMRDRVRELRKELAALGF